MKILSWLEQLKGTSLKQNINEAASKESPSNAGFTLTPTALAATLEFDRRQDTDSPSSLEEPCTMQQSRETNGRFHLHFLAVVIWKYGLFIPFLTPETLQALQS